MRTPALRAQTPHNTPATAAALAFLANAGITGSRWYRGLARGYDLAIFEQSAATWGHSAPVSHYRGLSLMGDHFSPIMALMALPWRIAPSGLTLVLVQSLLFALAVYLIAGYAQRAGLHGWPLGFVTTSGVGSFAFWSASSRDVHEIAFAVPLMAGVVIALLEQRRALLLCCCAALLLVKEDLGLTVVAIAGVCLLRHWGWRFCVMLVLGGIAGFVIALQVIGAVSGSGSIYLSYFGLEPQSVALTVSSIGGITPPQLCRVLPVVLFVIMAGGWGARSTIALAAVPTLLWRTVASRGNYWVPLYHYDAILWPIAMGAFIDVTHGRAPAGKRQHALLSACLAISVCVGGAALWGRMAPWGSSDRFTNLEKAARSLPVGVKVQADDATAPYLVSRTDVYPLGASDTAVSAVVFVPNGSRPSQPAECNKTRLLASLSHGGTVRTFGDVTVVSFKAGPMAVAFPSCGIRESPPRG